MLDVMQVYEGFRYGEMAKPIICLKYYALKVMCNFQQLCGIMT